MLRICSSNMHMSHVMSTLSYHFITSTTPLLLLLFFLCLYYIIRKLMSSSSPEDEVISLLKWSTELSGHCKNLSFIGTLLRLTPYCPSINLLFRPKTILKCELHCFYVICSLLLSLYPLFLTGNIDV